MNRGAGKEGQVIPFGGPGDEGQLVEVALMELQGDGGFHRDRVFSFTLRRKEAAHVKGGCASRRQFPGFQGPETVGVGTEGKGEDHSQSEYRKPRHHPGPYSPSSSSMTTSTHFSEPS